MERIEDIKAEYLIRSGELPNRMYINSKDLELLKLEFSSLYAKHVDRINIELYTEMKIVIDNDVPLDVVIVDYEEPNAEAETR